jgi:hypothetical protein
VLLVEPGTELARLSCRACHCQVRPGEHVLLAYRKGKPNLIHAHVCVASPARELRSAGHPPLPT